MRKTLPLLLLIACTGPDASDDTETPVVPDPYDVEIGPYEVEIRTTSYGIPHIQAADEGSLGFGLGHVWARNHGCTIADQIVKVRSERALYFGDRFVDSDFGWLHLRVREQAEAAWFDLSPELQARLVGVAAGYNAHLEENGLSSVCDGEPWVKPITHIDLLSYYFSLAQWGSGYNIVEQVGQAQPPKDRSEAGEVEPLEPPPMEILEPVKHPPIGSNGWAIGSEMSSTDGGMLLSNTHFPMTGERQWMEMHLTIPGELDVYGVGLVGLPLVAMGFNENIAWTHTVSNTQRFLPYLLDIQNDEVSYAYDGGTEAMTPTEYTIEVLQEDGSTAEVSRTLYDTRYGPMWNAPVVGWGTLGMTYRDVNWNNTGTIPTFDGMDRATDLESFKAAHRDYQGIPWVHTMATDTEGNAFYTDSAAAPNLSDEAWAAQQSFVQSNFFAQQFANFGLTVLDGSDPAQAWTEDPDAARPGAIPFDDSPQLTRRDYVTNANQNHWLANPDEPLTGYNAIYGPTGTPATPRTRMNHFYLQGLGEDPEIGDDGVFTLDEVEAAALSMRSSISELLLDDVVSRCQAHEGPVVVTYQDTEESVDIAPACGVLAGWDGRGGTESVGAHVWRELLASGPIMPNDLGDQGPVFAVPFDPADPINTPSGLAAPGERDPILDGLALATLRLDTAGLELDAPLGDVQIRKKGEQRIATPGGYYFEGYIGIATWSGGGDTTLLPRITRGEVVNGETGLTDEGYVITNGNSWVMAMQFGPDGPEARAVMTYSQSEDPDSPYFADQTELYATQSMRPILFRDADIEADPNLQTETLTLE